MTFRYFITDFMLNNYTIFKYCYPVGFDVVDLYNSHHGLEMIQHFMTIMNLYDNNLLTNFSISYTPLTSPKKEGIPNLADGLFYMYNNLPIKELIENCSIQYKFRTPEIYDPNKFLINVKKVFDKYNLTSSIIEIGVQKNKYLEEGNLLAQIPSKTFLIDYSFINQPVTEEFKIKSYELLEHLKNSNDLTYNENLDKQYHGYYKKLLKEL